ncbi:50S ribosomal protein L4 [Candidatus Woesearchaeota archaeon]|nr:50S ribosomal protein L4 [Candidatus Woesearchaeota archaeon]
MKVDILSLDGKKTKSIELPMQFEEEYRPDLIKRAILAIFNNRRQKYGAKARAGMRQSAKLSRRRRSYKTAYGHGISRVSRKVLWSRGTQFGWVGAVSPGTVGGRNAHPPKSEKNWEIKINKKERRKAIRSALNGAIKDIVIFEDKLEDINKTKDILNILNKIDIKINNKRKIRAGKGKIRGRRYKRCLNPLFIVSKGCNLINSSSNLTDIVKVNELNAALLTKGHIIPRKTIWSESAIKQIKEKNLFMEKNA